MDKDERVRGFYGGTIQINKEDRTFGLALILWRKIGQNEIVVASAKSFGSRHLSRHLRQQFQNRENDLLPPVELWDRPANATNETI